MSCIHPSVDGLALLLPLTTVTDALQTPSCWGLCFEFALCVCPGLEVVGPVIIMLRDCILLPYQQQHTRIPTSPWSSLSPDMSATQLPLKALYKACSANGRIFVHSHCCFCRASAASKSGSPACLTQNLTAEPSSGQGWGHLFLSFKLFLSREGGAEDQFSKCGRFQTRTLVSLPIWPFAAEQGGGHLLSAEGHLVIYDTVHRTSKSLLQIYYISSPACGCLGTTRPNDFAAPGG